MFHSKNSWSWLTRLLRAWLVLAMLATWLPQPVQAAPGTGTGGCVTYYQIQKHDTLAKIASLFGISVQRLAAANHRSPSADLKEGKFLCIPAIGFQKGYPKASLTAIIFLQKFLGVQGSCLEAKHKYNIKARPFEIGPGILIGTVRTDQYGNFEKVLTLPSFLRRAWFLHVCIKDAEDSSYIGTLCTTAHSLR